MSWTLLILLLAVAPARAMAQEPVQTGAVSGQVVDAQSGAPLTGAVVTAARDQRVIGRAVTDARGGFLLRVSPGPVAVTAGLLGYSPDTRPLEVTSGSTTRTEIRLAVAAIALAPMEIIGTSVAHGRMTGTATRVTPDAVRAIAPLGTQELLQHVPGVSGFADDGTGNSRISIGIRGLNPRRSSRVLILEDGIPIQPALYLYPNMYYNPPAERIDRVEVIKGSSAIRYGPHTMGGVVNYITSRPRDGFGGVGQVIAGNNGYLSMFTELGGWGTDRVRPEVQLLYKRGDGFRENNAFEQYNGTFKLNVVPDSTRTIYVKANANFEDSDATYTGLTEYSFRTNPNFNPKNDDNFRVFRTALDVLSTRRIAPSLTGDTRVYLSYFDRRWWREDDVFVRAGQWERGFTDPVPPFQPGDLVRVGGGVENHGNLRTFYVGGVEQTYALNHALFGADSRLSVGARGHWERFIDDKQRGASPDAREGVYFTGDPTQPDSVTIVGQSHHYETMALALFASEEVKSGRWTITPGVRFEVFEQERINRLQGSVYEDKTSWVLLPGLGANYELGRYHLFAGVHRGYTPPSSGTLQIANFGANEDDGGLDLRAERSWNYEAGVRGAIRGLTFEAAAFRVDIEDMVAAGRGTVFRNLGRVRSTGFELGGTARGSAVARYLPDLNVAYTFLRTQVVDGIIRSAVVSGAPNVSIAGKELPYAPQHTLVAGLSTGERNRVSLRTDVRYVSEVFTDFENIRATYNRGDTGPVPGYSVVDANLRVRPWERVTLSLGAKNLLDEIYIGSRLHSSPGQPDANLSSGILPGARRQITLGVRYDF